jgi:hypothetical protein
MDHYTAEKLFLARRHELEQTAERRALLLPPGADAPAPRVWIARRLRALADRLDEEPRLLRA